MNLNLHIKYGGNRHAMYKFLLVMKIATFLLILSIMQVSASSFAQKITLHKVNAPLTAIIDEIRNQSNYDFFYNKKLLKTAKTVTVNVKDASLEEVLEICFKGQLLDYQIADQTVLIKGKEIKSNFFNPMLAAVEKITGKVVDEKGQPIPGATVKVKATNKVTSADASGNFVIDAKEGDMLLVSSVGFVDQEIRVGKTSLTVALKEGSNTLEEMVVVGYGAKKKVNLTGSIDQVSAKDLDDRPASRLSQVLQGQMPGLNITTTTAGGAPNATQNINVRGFTGLGVSGGPLVVIDGVQGGDINSINPNDIESVTMLKDAASAAIYGSSAPYGVLLITTKKGKQGAPSVSYNNNLAFATPINLPKMMNSLDFADIYNEAYANAGRGVAFNDEVLKRMRDYQSGALTTETVVSKTTTDWWGSWFEANSNHDWFKEYFKDVSNAQQHNLSVTGGGNSSDYYIGLGYNDRQGMYNFGHDSYKRYNIRANLNNEITKWLGFSLRTALARSNYVTPNTVSGRTGGNYMHQIARKFPNLALYNPTGEYNEANDIMLHENGGRNNDDRNDVVTTGELRISPLNGLKITANYTFDGVFSNSSAHLKTLFTKLPSGNQGIISGTTPNSYSLTNTRTIHHIVNAFANYEKKVGDHNLGLTAGYVKELTNYNTTSGSNTNLYSDNIPSLSLTYGANAAASDGARQLAIEGVFGRFSYAYQDKYMLEVNGRYDGTSRFLAGVRWKFYPGISAGWNIDKEKFWQPISKVVNTFKLRLNYGSQADQQFLDVNGPNWYPFYPSLGTARPTTTSWFFGTAREASVSAPPLVNSDLTWVTTTTYGAGIDASFLRNRLNATFEWYNREAKDFAGPSAPLPTVLGAAVPTANNAAIQTKGFEISLKWNDKIGDFSYGIKATLADYRGKVTEYPNPNRLITDWYTGEVMGNIYGYTANGLYTADNVGTAIPTPAFWNGRWQVGDVKYEDLDGDGKITIGPNTAENMGDRSVIGNSTPRYQYGATFEFGWKSFDFSTFLQGIAKRDIFIGSNYFWGIQSSEFQSSPFTVHADRWSPTNQGGYFPRYYMNDEVNKNFQTSTRYLQNAAYMRIKNVQLGYTLPAAIASKVFLKRARLYVSVENLATFTDLIKTMDPELSLSDAKIYPLQRTYSFGLNLTL